MKKNETATEQTDKATNVATIKTLIVTTLATVFADLSRTMSMNKWKDCVNLGITAIETMPETFTASGGELEHGKKVFLDASDWACDLDKGRKAKAEYKKATAVERAGKLAIPVMVDKLDTLNKLQS